MILDYTTLKIIWYCIMLALLLGVVITVGMDLGVLSLLGVVAKTDEELRVIVNSIGPNLGW